MLLVLALLACDGADDTDAAACTGTEGTLRACVFMDASSETGEANGKVLVKQADDESYIEARNDDDGCVTLDLEVGDWLVRGEDGTGTCRSFDETVAITACETTEVRIEVIDGCVDG